MSVKAKPVTQMAIAGGGYEMSVWGKKKEGRGREAFLWGGGRG